MNQPNGWRLWIASAAALVALTVNVYADMSGRWEMHADFNDRSIPGAAATCTFTQDGDHLSGRCEDATLTGERKGDAVAFRVTLGGTGGIVTFTGMIVEDDDSAIIGKFTYPGKGDGSFLAIKRQPPR